MLIAHVITRLLRAGSEENTIATCLAQAKSGHDVVLIHGKDWVRHDEMEGAPAIELIELRELVHEVNPRKDLVATRKMAALFRRLRPAVVHTHQSKAGIVGRIAARIARVPFIVHGVHTIPFVNVGPAKKAMYVAAERIVAPFTDAFINVSAGTRQLCIDHSIGRPDQHFLVRSGMDITRFKHAPWPEDWRRLAGLNDGEPKPPIILMLAALEPRKRHVEFIEALPTALHRAADVRVLIAGEGVARGAIEAAIKRTGLVKNVRLLGFNSQPERLIALSDLTLLTSMREGLPRVVVQSLAGGRPVVTTDLPGIHEIVRTDVNGVVTPCDDLTATARVVVDLLVDRRRLERLQVGAAETDVSSWALDSMCVAISDVYHRIMSNPRSDGASALSS
jgi:glycosyltransferase involved in cell wall biosynthesis